MAEYEYCVLKESSALGEIDLKTPGKDGWRLCAITRMQGAYGEGDYLYYFVREVSGPICTPTVTIKAA